MNSCSIPFTDVCGDGGGEMDSKLYGSFLFSVMSASFDAA